MKNPRLHDKGPLTVMLVLAALLLVWCVVYQVIRSSKGRRVVQMIVPFSSSGEVKPEIDVFDMPTSGASV